MAIELIDKIKQKNNGTFKLIDAIDVEMADGSDAESTINSISKQISEHIKNHPSGGTSSSNCNVWGGEEEPPSDNYEVWIDTTDVVVEADNEIKDTVLEEIQNMFLFLSNRISKLEEDNLILKAEIESLKQGVIPPASDKADIIGAMLLPDGTPLLFDDNSYILYSHGSVSSDNDIENIHVSEALLLDNKDPLLLKDNNYLLYHNGKIKE